MFSASDSVFSVGCLVLGVIVLRLTAQWILGPIGRVSTPMAPRRFQLNDCLWLLIMLQAVLAVSVQFIGLESGFFNHFLAFLIFAVTGIWIGAVSFLSKVGITNPMRRASFVLFVLPATLAVLIAIPMVSLLGVLRAGEHFHYLQINDRDLSWSDMGLATLVTAACGIGFGLLSWTLRQVAMWVAFEGGRGSLMNEPAVTASHHSRC
jgi:hypothetical protein